MCHKVRYRASEAASLAEGCGSTSTPGLTEVCQEVLCLPSLWSNVHATGARGTTKTGCRGSCVWSIYWLVKQSMQQSVQCRYQWS